MCKLVFKLNVNKGYLKTDTTFAKYFMLIKTAIPA